MVVALKEMRGLQWLSNGVACSVNTLLKPVKIYSCSRWFVVPLSDFSLYSFSSVFSYCCPQPLSNAYHELAQVYTTNNPAELRSVVNKHSETFTRDNNTGLVKQCLSSLYKKNIQRLTKVGCYINTSQVVRSWLQLDCLTGVLALKNTFKLRLWKAYSPREDLGNTELS